MYPLLRVGRFRVFFVSLLIPVALGFAESAQSQDASICPPAQTLQDATVVLPAIENGESAFLVRCGLDINHPMELDGALVRPIDLAAADPDPWLAEQVLQAGADPNDDGGPDMGVFPLDTALAAHNLNTARMMLRHGARADYRQPSSGMTALMAIAFFKDSTLAYTALVNTLIQHGAQINAQDKHGDSALHWAARLGNEPLIRVLLAHRARICTTDNKGLRPIQLLPVSSQAELFPLLQGSCAAKMAVPTQIPPQNTAHKN